jgi:hypothetical protein
MNSFAVTMFDTLLSTINYTRKPTQPPVHADAKTLRGFQGEIRIFVESYKL